MTGKSKNEKPHTIKHWSTMAFFVMAGTSLLVGCGSVAGNASVHHQTTANTISNTANMTNAVVNTIETGNLTSNTSSTVGTGPENNSTRDGHTSSVGSSKPSSLSHVAKASNRTASKSSSTQVASKSSGSPHTSGGSLSSGDSGSGTSKERNSSSDDSTKNSTSSKDSPTPTIPAQPSGIDTVKTNALNNELGQLDYTGTNRSQFDSVVVQMAEGTTTPSQAKATIQALKPWNAIWNDAPGGPATYQFQVHDVEAYTFQTKSWSDSVTSKEFQTHGFLDDTAYQKFAVYWNASSQEYTVAMLAVGFYYYSQ